MVRVNIHSYRKGFGDSDSQHDRWKTHIKNVLFSYLLDSQLDAIDVFNMEGEAHNIRAGVPGRELKIYFNAVFGVEPGSATLNRVGVVVTPQTTMDIDGVLLPIIDDAILITDTAGTPIAEYSSKREELNILFDLGNNPPSDDTKDIFRYIISKLQEGVFSKVQDRLSWINTDNKEQLISQFKERIIGTEDRRIREMEQGIDSYSRDIREYQRRLAEVHRNLITRMEQVKSAKERRGNVTSKLVDDMDLVASLDKVKDLKVQDNIIKVSTKTLYMYDNAEENRYKLGEIEMHINMDESDVRFYNHNNSRRSYWSGNDPHPHIDGHSGEACLGNVAPTIAELSAQNEIYALVLTAIDFLENANTEDPAGENVRNWDMVDENGKVISEGNPNGVESCSHCGDDMDDGEGYTVYNNIDGDDVMDEATVCEDCRSEEYYYSEIYDEALHESVDDQQFE